MKTKIILVAVLAALAIIPLVQNTQMVTFRIYFWTVSVSQVILVPLAVVLGFLLGYVARGAKKQRRQGGP